MNKKSSVFLVFGICILQIQIIIAFTSSTARKNITKSLTFTPHRRMIFSFESLDLLETACIWVCMLIMLHKEYF